MSKFSSLASVAKGTRARLREVECTTLEGEPFKVDIRVLSGEEETRVVAAASTRAREAGGQANETDLVFQMAFAQEAVAAFCVDPESPDDKPQSFFGSCSEGAACGCKSAVDQVRTHLDRERTLLLSEMWRRFQEQASPRRHKLSETEFISLVLQTARTEEGEDCPFERLPRFTRNDCWRRLAVPLLISQTDKSPTSSEGFEKANS